MCLKINKGAMFGLDARIALAIFGALSVISGAALYNAIQYSKVVSTVTTANELSKSLESYLVDVGENLAYSSVASHRKIDELVSSSKSNWKGPYVSYAVSADHTLVVPAYTAGQILTLVDDAWVFPVLLGSPGEQCSSGSNCYNWISLSNVPNEIATAADLYVDGVANRLEGNLRLVYPGNDSTKTYSHIFLKGPPLLN